MNQTLAQLLETINEEINQYRDMQAVLIQEREAATGSDKDQLTRVGQTKQAIVQNIVRSEVRRQALVEQLASTYAIKAHPLTVSTLCAHLEAPHDDRLRSVASDLKTIMESVQMENNANAKLFSQTLELIHGSLKLLNELIYSHAVYHKPGNEKRMPGYSNGRGRVFCGSV